MDAPSSITKFLVADEIIERDFRLNGGKSLYASNKRLFIKKGSTVRDIDYKHISSIEIKQERKWILLVLGIILFIFGCVALGDTSNSIITFIDDYIAWILLPVGLILIVAGWLKKQFVSLTVVGLTEPKKLKSTLSNLEDIFKLIREKRL